jgi:hypothetical protein
MHKTTGLVIPWIIIFLPFLILASFYRVLPAEVLIAKNLDGSGAVFGPKSIFTVFRVPLIEVVCALAIEIMRRRFSTDPAHMNYYLMWTVLLYTVALKSLFQSLEIVSTGRWANRFLYLTIGIVVTGILAAVVPGIKAFSGSTRGVWKLGFVEIAALGALLLAYIAFALVPIYIFA